MGLNALCVRESDEANLLESLRARYVNRCPRVIFQDTANYHSLRLCRSKPTQGREKDGEGHDSEHYAENYSAESTDGIERGVARVIFPKSRQARGAVMAPPVLVWWLKL